MQHLKSALFALLIGSLGLVALPSTPVLAQAALTGAGATFPEPIYSRWFSEYNKKTGVKINYQAIGSGGGIKQILAKTVDFGASDAAMSDEDLAKAGKPILMIPTVAGPVAITYNLSGVASGLKINAYILADIFQGRIKKWNDRRIAEINPSVSLPDVDIQVVHRSDGSGTTRIFTDYLSKVDSGWATRIGSSTAVKWPTGLGGKGTEGVASLVKQTPGAIGYVEYAYAQQNQLSVAAVENYNGIFVLPTLEGASAAADGAVVPENYRVFITNSKGKTAYPISGFTWLLVYQQQDDATKGKTLVDFLWWAIHDGQKFAASLNYADLPPALVKRLEKSIKTISYNGKALLSEK
ncbi:phosphate ABC transporter substrate-binding protein PstS [Anthocerotibacter panamensis]|uniref:phosphate ABC transporter substrate-binding protein PstS n=1 Tax=Anthocerotibacter panamensis TaxID=2857077 RepID=UPI001C402EAD|nr:phosphate ABC transporter substrate-binding protein PstS [Anthocerotibacter panamensis]